MCGRAGRKGKDDAGETYLICVKADMQAVCDLLDADMPAIESCLAPEKRGLKRYVFIVQLYFFVFKAFAHTPKGFTGSRSNGTGIRLRGDQRICSVHAPLPYIGQEDRIHHHEIRSPRTSRRRTSYFSRR